MAGPRLYWQPKNPAMNGPFFSNVFLRRIQLVGEYLGWYAVEILFSQVSATPFIGELVNVSDATSATPGDIVAGGGTFHILARWDGTNWRVMGGSSGSSGLAPANAQYLVSTANGALTAERVATNTASVTWDFGTAAQAKANVPANAVTDAILRQSAGLSVIGRSANSTGNVADVTAASDGQVLRRSGTAVGFGAVNLASANAVTGVLPVANGGGMQLATVTLTNAQIKALPTTPVLFGTAPPSGSWNHAVAASYVINTLGGAYTNINVTLCEFSIIGGSLIYGPIDDVGSNPVLTTFTSLFGSAVHDTHTPLTPYAESFPYPAGTSGRVMNPIFDTTASVDAKQFTVQINNNGSGNLTGGNAANNVIIRVYYFEETL